MSRCSTHASQPRPAPPRHRETNGAAKELLLAKGESEHVVPL